jgi:hypothetical protein
MMSATMRRCRLGPTALVATLLAMAGEIATPSIAWADPVPAVFLGTWSPDCANKQAARIILEPATVTIVLNGKNRAYTGIEVSRTWMGGAKATGDKAWLLTSKGPGQPLEFVVAPQSNQFSALVLEEGHPDYGRGIRHLFGPRFQRCTTGDKRAQEAGGSMIAGNPSPAKKGKSAGTRQLDVPIQEQAGDGQAANCVSSAVTGLKADGDGFLAVRSGPGSQYRKIDELRLDEIVIVFEYRGKWAGIVYRTQNVRCSSKTKRPVTYERKGWVHTNWLKHIAG